MCDTYLGSLEGEFLADHFFLEEMSVEKNRRGSRDQFPVGMRVLAVDDDLTCLKLLETLLRRCRYHVTITNQAIVALKLLRENRDRFDLVISDVHMPDMDGFKLLELVGLEMDLPVIMLSADGETQTVMKGITHGAVDYLLKPIRIEELKNIWQHAIRRRFFDHRDQHNSENGKDSEKPQNVNSEGAQGALRNGSVDRNGKLNGKRKDRSEEDEDYCEEDMHESEDSSAQKRPRVVWSIELHRKFVSAINQLGLDKAVPKRILDLMNVEKLTRENVASHLQKYRLCLKRLSSIASQQANMVATLGHRDMSYLPMHSVDGFANFHVLPASDHPPALPAYQTNGVLNLTSPTASGLHSGMVHFGHSHNTTSPTVSDLHKLQHINLPGSKHGGFLQGMPMSLDLEKLQQQKRMLAVNNHLHVSLSRSEAPDNSINSFINVTDSPLVLQGQQQHLQSVELSNQSSVKMVTMSSSLFDMSTRVPSFSPDLGRCNEDWKSAVPLNGYSSKTLSLTAPSARDDITSSMTGDYAMIASQIGTNPLNISSSFVVAAQRDLAVRRDRQRQESSVGTDTMLMSTSIGEDSKLNFRSTGNSRPELEERKRNHASEPSLKFGSSLNFPLSNHPVADPTAENRRLLHSKKIDTSIIGQMNYSAPLLTHCKIDKEISKFDGLQNFKDEYSSETSKLSGVNSNNCNFDDLMNAMIKREQDDSTFMDGVGYDGDMAYDVFPLGTCM